MADIITGACNGLPASSSGTDLQPVARWNVLLGYLKEAGLCEPQLRDVQNILIDISLQDINISIWRLDGETLELTISGHLTAVGLKRRIAIEWAIQASSLQLAIGATFLRDSDVVAEIVSLTDRVVTAVVSVSRASQDPDPYTEVNDDICWKLEKVLPYMDEALHQELMTLWEESCQGAQVSCEAAASAYARLSPASIRNPMGHRTVNQIVQDARRQIRSALVKRAEGWQVSNTRDGDKMRCVFERLSLEAGCEDNTVSQLMNWARRLEEQREEQQDRRRFRLPAALNIPNVAGGPDCVN